MRFQFDRTMELSNQLIRDEFRAINVARRLQEQNEYVVEPSASSLASSRR